MPEAKYYVPALYSSIFKHIQAYKSMIILVYKVPMKSIHIPMDSEAMSLMFFNFCFARNNRGLY